MKILFSMITLATLSLASPNAQATDAGHIVAGAPFVGVSCMLGALAVGETGHLVGMRISPKADDVMTVGGGAIGCVAGGALGVEALSNSPGEGVVSEAQLQSDNDDASE